MSRLTKDTLATLRAMRQDLHAHPEVAGGEKRTARIVADYLRRCGVDEVHENIGGYGVAGVLNGKEPGKSIALRADMDALPMREIAGEGRERPYCSTVPGRFHGCGHDGHTVMLLGAAGYLAAHRDFSGRVVLIFQPGEEDLSGALAMLEDGLFDRFPCTEVYGLHNIATAPLGHVVIPEARVFSGCDNFTIDIHGKGSHGATPHLSIDPIVAGSRLVLDFQTIVSRNVSPLKAVALSFGEIRSGSANNVIPDSLRLRGTLRTYDEDTRALAKERMRVLVEAAALGFGCKATLDYTRNCPPLVNDGPLALELYRSIVEASGEERVSVTQTPLTPSEDFSFYLRHVRGVYAFIGQGAPQAHHHPAYDFNDELIPYGVDFWITVARSRLCAP